VFLVALVVITKTDFVIYLLPVVAALVVGYYTVLIRDVLRRYRGSNEKAGWIVAMLFFWPAGLIYFFMFYSPIATHKKEEK
jgi:drug/metabolite transporter (DMT)-like permease